MNADPESQLLMDGSVVSCWACNILVAVPLGSDGLAAPVFKCGWCGAVNDLQQCLEDTASGNGYQSWQQQQQLGPYSLHIPSVHQQQRRNSIARHARCLASVCLVGWRWAVVALVVLLVGSIAGTGIVLLLPMLCTTWLTYLPNLAVSLYLCVCVTINYTAAVLQSPGRVSECVPSPVCGPHGQILQGAYDMYSFCRHCRAAKPPVAHHCSACRLCIVDMDHHCPFINNCVGRGNLRPFLLFLLWTILAAAYVLLMCSVLVWREWDVVRDSTTLHTSLSRSGSSINSSITSTSIGPSSSSSSPAMSEPSTAAVSSGAGGGSMHLAAAGQSTADTPWSTAGLLASGGMLLLLLQLAPGWLLTTYYLAAASAALLLAVGALLASQLSYLARGVTYIQYLKGSASTAAAGTGGIGEAAFAGADSITVQQQLQQMFDGRPCSDSAVSVSAAAAAAEPSAWKQQQEKPKQHQVLLRRPGKCQLLWLRVREALGAGDSSGSLAKAVLVPRWQPVAAVGTTAATKKWS